MRDARPYHARLDALRRERSDLVVTMRDRDRMSFAAIGLVLRITTERAMQIYGKATADTNAGADEATVHDLRSQRMRRHGVV